MANNKMERFTQRARRVLSIAQEAAEELKHSTIDTEHILLGLVREEGGIAGHVLRASGVEQQKVQELVEELTHATPRKAGMTAELSPDTKRVLEMGVDEARQLGHHYIGTEHILLGLLRFQSGVGIDVLKRLNLSLEEIRDQTLRILKESPVQKPSIDSPSAGAPTIMPAAHIKMIEVMERVIDRVLQMITDGKLTVEQGKELLSALEPNINWSPGDSAQLVSRFVHPDLIGKRRLRVILTQQDKNTRIEFTVGLEAALRNIDMLLGAVMQNRDTEIQFDDAATNTLIEVLIEKANDD